MIFESLQGWTDYEKIRKLQLDLVQKRIDDQIEDRVLFLEHSPVVTQGRGLQRTENQPEVGKNLEVQSLPETIHFSKTERGGDLTYHGPGQLVIYPIFKLHEHDVEGFIRKLEQVVSLVLSQYSIDAKPKESATGVWTGDRKIASIGIAVKRWVSFHGIALNVVNDLKPFSYFQPCGFNPEVMTSIKKVLEERYLGFTGDWRAGVEKKFEKAFQSIFTSQSIENLKTI